MFPVYASTAEKECACLSARKEQAFSVDEGKEKVV